MKAGFAKLIKAEPKQGIDPKNNGEFLFSFRQSLLQMLKEEGFLTEAQHTQALSALRRESSR